MHDIVQIAVLLLELYVALGIMLLGLGYMVGGKNLGGRVARFYFAGPLRWSLWRLRRLLAALIAVLSGTLMFWVIRPIGYRLWRGIRWFLTRERGWLQPW
jgi:hypothetical protein